MTFMTFTTCRDIYDIWYFPSNKRLITSLTVAWNRKKRVKRHSQRKLPWEVPTKCLRLWADLTSPLLIPSNVHFFGKMSGYETFAVIGRLPTSDKFHTSRISTHGRKAQVGHINRVVAIKTPTWRHQSLHVALRFCENFSLLQELYRLHTSNQLTRVKG